MKFLARRKTRFHLSFSFAEQGIACLCSLFNLGGFDISAAELRKGRPVSQCGFVSLPELSNEIGFYLSQVDLNSNGSLETIDMPIIVSLRRYGIVILEQFKQDQFWMNNPSKGWSIISHHMARSLLKEEHGYTLEWSQKAFFPSRRKPFFLTAIFLSDKSFAALALLIILIAILHGIASLLDPVMKNIYFTNVVQMSMLDWARPIAIFYFLSAIFAGLLLLLSTILSALLSNRMALRWSFSVFSSMLRLPAEFTNIRANGDLMSRVRSSEALASFVGSQEIMLVGSLGNLLLMSYVLFSVSPLLSIVLIAFQVVGVSFVFLSNPGRKERSDQLHQHSAAETSSFIKIFGNISTYKYLRRDLFAFRFHLLAVARRIRSQQHLSIYTNIVNFVTSTVDQLQSIILLTVASFLIIDGQVSLGEYIGFSAMLSLVISPIKRFSHFIGSWQSMRTIHERVLDVCEEASLASTRSLRPTENEELMILGLSDQFISQQPDYQRLLPLRLNGNSMTTALYVPQDFSLETVEKILAGDDILPDCYKIQVIHRQGIKKFLVARSKPFLYPANLMLNVTLHTNTAMQNQGVGVDDLIRDLQLDLRISDGQDTIFSYSKMQLHRLGILRTLWQYPEVMVITACEEDTAAHQLHFHSLLRACCDALQIRLIFLSDQESCDNKLWENQVNLSPWLQALTLLR